MDEFSFIFELFALLPGRAVAEMLRGFGQVLKLRARRSDPAFAAAWNGALLAARPRSEDALACRAIDGIEEQVFYHGEVIATRTRFDSRLLLAHLARLDKLVDDPAAAAFAGDFDAALARFAEGLEQPPSADADCAPGQCATCAKSNSAGAPMSPPGTAWAAADDVMAAPEPAEVEEGPQDPCATCGGQCNDPAARLTQADCQWLGNRLDRMEAARPLDAPELWQFGGRSVAEVEAEQLAAFEAGAARWWLVVPPGEGDDPDVWTYRELP